ncbi:dihydroxyacetone kinase family protein [Arthrobacter sp. zg-ZUI100]|uniref:dihydroxyacetone kinase family protein n=1 Tax=Arthrobacter jiangjiafuii TaxID=2817475 RepID=UPI001AED3A4F|nr:dihydroxyacetone kinase family protein [Arthrobacter jiangjiafuii]MBP3037527.1 dihydroxyacetone kinase family protein [Arthrobacter jiangjiafuii]MBP3037545.1 dihydroxyacetone kinase family protein [Arthrobacter jiangjiafuii]
MTHIYNDPADFAEEALRGFVTLHEGYVRQVPGGVVRRRPGRNGKTVVIFGGGSGHYPAFAGLVGPGFGDGSVVGNIFTSPSAQHAYSVGRQANRGGGVIFSFGNYAGDVMNFGIACEQLAAEGIDARNVIVTDDVLSASVEEIHKRRGIAGDFVVFKVLAAAAETGADINEVERLGRLANDRTRSAGIAFSGCSFPGSPDPLFTVEPGHMAVGLGIHGEPGLETVRLQTAEEIGKMLVITVLAERPAASSDRVGVILNGLGSTKYEELFLLWGEIVPRLAEAGLQVVEPEVGELVTSLDMAGVSLSLVWLDEELEALWSTPVDTPAFRKGFINTASTDSEDDEPVEDAVVDQIIQGTPISQRAAADVVALIGASLGTVSENEETLAQLDAVAGDGDHGRGMVRGLDAALTAATYAAEQGAGAGTTLTRAGEAWAEHAGGTSGVLWGSALSAAGQMLGDETAIDAPTILKATEAFAVTLTRLGKATVGDKTMVDAVTPFVVELRTALNSSQPVSDALNVAALAASSAAKATADLLPKLGRARPHAQKSLGSPDPGAISFALIVSALADSVISGRKAQAK